MSSSPPISHSSSEGHRSIAALDAKVQAVHAKSSEGNILDRIASSIFMFIGRLWDAVFSSSSDSKTETVKKTPPSPKRDYKHHRSQHDKHSTRSHSSRSKNSSHGAKRSNRPLGDFFSPKDLNAIREKAAIRKKQPNTERKQRKKTARVAAPLLGGIAKPKESQRGFLSGLFGYLTSTRSPRGLKNPGVICYANATLQAFVLNFDGIDRHLTKKLTRSFTIEGKPLETPEYFKARKDVKDNLRFLKDEFAKNEADINTTRVDTLSSEILHSPVFARFNMNRIQGDSQEFLTAILVALEATNDPNLGLSVIPKFTAVHHPGVEKTTGPVQMPVIVLKGVNKRGQTSFQWCLDRLLKNERLGRDEANVEFEDDRISDRANRRDFLCAPEGRVPGTLLFNMPRYRYYKARNRRYKIEVTIAGVEGEHRVPISDRDGNLVGHAIYETVAASCHSGTTHGGHYKAIIKGADGEWEMRNDEAVTKISDREATNLLQNNSYVIRDRLIRYEPIGQA